jgi:hypothetical protein
MTNRMLRRLRGAQPGNQNGRKHGFYSKIVRIPGERDFLPTEATLEELDRTIVVTRMKVRELLSEDHRNDMLFTRSASLLNRLVRTRDLIAYRRRKQSRRAAEKLGQSLSITLDPNPAQEHTH